VAALVALSSGGVCAQGERPEGVPEIVIDHERMCPVVDGEPFFAIGCCGIPPEHMKEAAEAGFNLTFVGALTQGSAASEQVWSKPCTYDALRLHLHIEGVTEDARAP